MSNNLVIGPYELSIWQEEKITNSNNIVIDTVEKFMFLIGADSMNTPAAAFDIILDTDINGSHNLTFSLNSHYIDYESKFRSYTDNKGETGNSAYINLDEKENFIENPYIPYLYNEAKLKLKYKNKWYDFVIKDKQENSENYTFTYKAIDLHINELSRNGFDVELATDLQNNLGTAQELASRILEGTEWQIDTTNIIKQYADEPLYKATTKKSFSAVAIDGDKSTITVAAGKEIYIFYSCLLTENPFFQFLILDDPDDIKTTSSGVILNAKLYAWGSGDGQYNKMTYTANKPDSLINIETLQLENYYRGKRLVLSEKTVYDAKEEKFVTECTGAANPVYRYQETKFQNDYPENLLVEHTNFTTKSNWKGALASKYEIDENKNIVIYPTDNSVSNISLSRNEKIAELVKGDWVMLLLHFPNRESFQKMTQWNKFWSNNNTNKNGVLTNLSAVYLYNSKMDYRFCPFYYWGRTDTINNNNHGLTGSENRPDDLKACPKKYLGNNWNDIFPYELKRMADSNTGYMATFLGLVNTDFSLEDLLEQTQLTFRTPGDISESAYLTISKIDIFPMQTKWVNSNDVFSKQLMFPTNEIDNAEIEQSISLYTYYTYNNNKKNILEQSPTLSTIYLPSHDYTFSKRTSIEGKESNRFNLTQDICEKFECWAQYDIEHAADGTIAKTTRYVTFNDDGKIIYNDTNVTNSTRVQVPKKTIRFFEPIKPQNKGFGFKYGLNLDSISRTVNSDQITTYTIVQDNANEFATNGFCSIARAKENYSKENAILNLDYYVQMGLIDKQKLTEDLYSMKEGDLGYYYNVRKINDTIDQKNQVLIKKTIELDHYKAEVDLLILEEQAKRQQIVEKEQELKAKQGHSYQDLISNNPGATVVNILTQTWVKNLVNAITNLLNKETVVATKKESVVNKYNSTKTECENLKREIENLIIEKEKIISKFRNKYSRFIQEGTWISEDYIDDNKYYLDALKVANTSAYPQISYDINIVDLSVFSEYSLCNYETGNLGTVEDPEFFGYDANGLPVQEEVLITHKQEYLTAPDQNKITVQNYRTEFQDLFQRVTAAVQTLEFKGGTYQKFSNIITPEGEIRVDVLQSTINNNKINLQNAGVQSVDWGEKGITVTSVTNPSKILRIINDGIYITNDGGETYFNAIRGDGISASVINTGALNTQLITIANSSTPSFHWDSFGLSAFAYEQNSSYEDGYAYDLTKYVRFDQYGIYGIKGQTVEWRPEGATIEKKIDDIINKAQFSLTWKGFSLKTGDTSGVKISTEEDLVLYDGNTNILKIGRVGQDENGKDVNGIVVERNGVLILNNEKGGSLKLSSGEVTFQNTTVDYILNYTSNNGDQPNFSVSNNGFMNIQTIFLGKGYTLESSVGRPQSKWGYSQANDQSLFSIGFSTEEVLSSNNVSYQRPVLDLCIGKGDSSSALKVLGYINEQLNEADISKFGFLSTNRDCYSLQGKFSYFNLFDSSNDSENNSWEGAYLKFSKFKIPEGDQQTGDWQTLGSIQIRSGSFNFLDAGLNWASIRAGSIQLTSSINTNYSVFLSGSSGDIQASTSSGRTLIRGNIFSLAGADDSELAFSSAGLTQSVLPISYSINNGNWNAESTQSIAYYLNANQKLRLTGKNRISKQFSGYIIVWKKFNGTSASNDDINYSYIPKSISNTGGVICCPLGSSDGAVQGVKTLTITDTDSDGTIIQGNNNNSISGKSGYWVITNILNC